MGKLVDAKGQNCPIPVIMAKKEIDVGNRDFIVEVDETIAVENLKKLAENQGYSSSAKEEGGIYQVTFSKTGDAPTEGQKQPEPHEKTGNWALFISKNRIGEGSEELGASLIKMFFYTLTQSEDIPKYILFMNSGVKLPTQDEQVVEHLKALQQKGSEILVCGTCLNYFELTPQLKVGTVSNMYDITQRMQMADKVITV